jgi:hypothetical protein
MIKMSRESRGEINGRLRCKAASTALFDTTGGAVAAAADDGRIHTAQDRQKVNAASTSAAGKAATLLTYRSAGNVTTIAQGAVATTHPAMLMSVSAGSWKTGQAVAGRASTVHGIGHPTMARRSVGGIFWTESFMM